MWFRTQAYLGDAYDHGASRSEPALTAWTDEELAATAGANELTVAPLRNDGTVQSPRIVWVVRRGDDVYIRSVNGDEGAWFRGVQAHHAGHISAGGLEVDVSFEDADHDLDDAINEEYRRKCGRSSAVEHITSPKAQATTLRIVRS
jgi:hypothetical protein